MPPLGGWSGVSRTWVAPYGLKGDGLISTVTGGALEWGRGLTPASACVAPTGLGLCSEPLPSAYALG